MMLMKVEKKHDAQKLKKAKNDVYEQLTHSEYTGDPETWITPTTGQNISQNCIIRTGAKNSSRHTLF